MKKILSFACAVFFLFPLATAPVIAFNMTIAPAKEIFEMNRSESKSYQITFRNDSDSGRYQARVVDFVYNESGVRNFIEKKDLADPGQSLTSWVHLGNDQFQAVKGVDNKISVLITIPKNGAFGDHFGVILVEKISDETTQDAGPVTVGGSIASVLAVKVLGGKSIKSGGLVDYQISTQEKARNTVNFEVKFNNTGNEFYGVLAEIGVYDKTDDQKPIKVLSRDFTVFPNVVRELKIPLGDLGDDYGEKDYSSKLSVYEFYKGSKVSLMASSEKAFHYYVPISTDAEIQYVAKDVTTPSAIVQVLQQFGWYIAGFILLLVVLIRVLFFRGSPSATPSSKRGRNKNS